MVNHGKEAAWTQWVKTGKCIHVSQITHFIDFSLSSSLALGSKCPYLFKALELLRGVDSLFALGTLLAHLGVTWVISAASGGKTRPPKNDLKWHLSPFTRSLLSICCVSPVLLGKITEGGESFCPFKMHSVTNAKCYKTTSLKRITKISDCHKVYASAPCILAATW